MYRLNQNDFRLVRPLFTNLEKDYLAIQSIFEGFIDGEIYVDNIDLPKVALLLHPNIRNFHLAGKEIDDSAIESLRNFLETELFPRYPEKQGKNILVHSEDHLFDKLHQIFDNLEQIKKCFYVLEDLDEYSFSVELPSDYAFAKIDRELFERSDLINYNIIPGWIEGTWSKKEHYFSRGFGYSATFKDEEIACVVFSCYASKQMDECELGVITYEKHRQKGLARSTISKTINHCKEVEMKRISWHCRDSNIPSKKTAETVGFKLKKNGYEFQGIWK